MRNPFASAYLLAFLGAVLAAPLDAADVTFRVVDQYGVEIPGSLVRVLGGSVHATGATASLAEGTYALEIVPGVLGFAEVGGNNGGRLFRTEEATVTSQTTELTFEWIESDVTLRVRDQFGSDISGSLIQLANYAGLWPSPPGVGHPTGTTVRLPITDGSVYPTRAGSESGGYRWKVIPGVLGFAQEHGNFVGFLLREEVAPVTATTTQIAFEWIESDVTLRVRDQLASDIPGSRIQLATFAGLFPSLPGVGHLTGTTLRLPITDGSLYPTSYGSERDGYRWKVIPGVLGWAQEHGNFAGFLLREEVVPVASSTTQIAFEWIESDVTLQVRDQFGTDIPGSRIQLATFAGLFPSLPGVGHLTGTTLRLPITDGGVYPTSYGSERDGYWWKVIPGLSGFSEEHGNAAGLLLRRETVAVTQATSGIAFDWLQFSCPIAVVDPQGAPVGGSTIFMPTPFSGVVQPGDSVALPTTDETLYPTLEGAYAGGYPITVAPGDVAPASGTIPFEMTANGEFAPPIFSVAGNSYRLVCGADTDGDGLNDGAEVGIHGTNPFDPDTDDDGLMDGTEVETAQAGCPNPLDSDSDDDGLSDGAEVTAGTNPCNADSDGDGISDGSDPLPLQPGVTCGFLEQMMRSVAANIEALDLALFNGANANANSGRRNSLATRVQNAANHLCDGQGQSALANLNAVLEKVDGLEPTPDWMFPSTERTALKDSIELLISLTQLLG